ncbi:MAG TPA: hypothetical protein EYP22_06230 [Methanosarcinales archaeon]|nr:hypothetical protein [Methanosarcinales archaeon]
MGSILILFVLPWLDTCKVRSCRFRQIDQVVRLKICLYKEITNDYNLSFCKEKVVY